MSNDWIEHRSSAKPSELGNDCRVEVQYVGANGTSAGRVGCVNWQAVTRYRVDKAPHSDEQSSGGDNDWTEHNSGLCPYGQYTPVDVQTPAGRTIRGGIASDYYWGEETGHRYTVARYRLTDEHPAPVEQSSGGDNDYWVVDIVNPKRMEPARVECEDVIQALGMTFGEGEAFKAIWRGCAARLGNGKPGDTAMRNAEKVVHYGEYMKRGAK